MKCRKFSDISEKTRKQRNRMLAEELRKNKRKARGQMRLNGGRCCLQVAEDLAIKCGLDIDRSDADSGEPGIQVQRFYGWKDRNPSLISEENKRCRASVLNDGNEVIITSLKKLPKKGYPHKKIAEFFEKTYG